VATLLSRPAGLPLEAASWAQTLLVIHQLVVQLLAVIQQQAVRIVTLEARVSQHKARRNILAHPHFW
jgi:hypothetical protein